VGIDVEQIMGTRRFERVISMIASPAEFRRLKEGVDWSNEQLATLVFSAKESAFKCQHPIGQRYWEFEQYSVESIDSGARAFTIRMPDGPLALGRFHVADGYAFTGMVLPPASS
jgi:enterobactin synthetase component D